MSSQEFNSCASLHDWYQDALNHYNDLISKGKDPFQEMLTMQKNLQINLHEKLPEQTQNIVELKKVWDIYENLRSNFDAIGNEYWELIDSLPWHSYLDAKSRSAVWKKWKSEYNNVRNIEWKSLSKDDQLETLFEMIDIMHFVYNMILTLWMDAKEVFILYYLKNKENFRRYENKY